MKLNKKKKIIIGVVASVMVLGVGLTLFLSSFLADFALDTEAAFNMQSLFALAAKNMSENTDEAEEMDYSGFIGTSEENTWFEEASKDVYVTSEDGLKLHAYLIVNSEKNSNGNFMMIFHGYTSQGRDMAHSARHFYDMGYSLLVPDARSHGKSEGRYITMGWAERLDNLLWIEKILELDSDAKIGLYGISMGGATVVNTAGEALPENVVVAVEDCGYSSVWDEFSAQMGMIFRLPTFPLLNIAARFAKADSGFDLTEADSTLQASKIKIPTLFIHGSGDTFVPYEMLDKLYSAAVCEKEKLVVEGAGHAMSSSADPELYWSTVDSFVEKQMKD